MQSPFANMPPVIKNLLIINVICFIPFIVFKEPLLKDIYNNVSAHYFDSPMFEAWQPITYMFFHGGWAHIIFNMFALYSFGTIIEYNMGSKRFFNYYFICGLGGVALQLLVQAIEVHAITGAFTIANPESIESYVRFGENGQKLYDIYHGPMVGASGAIFGVLIAFGLLYPNAELMIMFIPVPVKAKYIIPVYIVIEVFLGVARFAGDSVAHFAHLGGALIGFGLIKLWGLRRNDRYY
ncbi:rhomboid family intramembrane serine protease [Mucilaginibacter sp. JRF]|uniref:rhomboid family intramembrane serine protease n=1 Tax=Mucilaginibacter sp. JRF TaxID=2780088 RepID=UPI00187F10CF|nr:rhomboid family intramembrane serine protease [Mucilaginibacter sp. JRF]MBE9584994.1 rhomboid family intramembrane serine protease [Mucilaginibacter sp. JRF]